MTEREALKLALEALEVANSCVDGYYIPKGKTHLPEVEQAITAIKEALAQPAVSETHKQSTTCGEPAAWPIETNNQVEALAKRCGWDNRRHMTPEDYQIWCDRMRQFVQLATPPQRTWVGLTDIDYAGLPLEQVGLVRWAEAKLKAKNFAQEKNT